jgi:AraC-like DNA-binding protein
MPQDAAKTAFDRLLAGFDIAALFAFGNEYRGYRGIRRSYGEARLAMEYNESRGNAPVFFYNEVPKPRDRYIYSIDQERRLMDGIKTGESRIVEDLLDELQKENLDGGPLNPEIGTDLLGELRNTLIKLTAQAEGIPAPPELDRDKNFATNFRSLREAFLSAADSVHRSRSASYPVVRSVLDEMESDFGNQQLGLASLAEKYRISESYLSRLFKEVTGRNFHAYLNRLRMNKACELLDRTELSVDDIAVQAGFASTRVFRRAFKRDTGVAPSDYRSKKTDKE